MEIVAIADADHSKLGRLSISITPAPGAVEALAGTYTGTAHDHAYTPSNPPTNISDTDSPGTHYTFTATGAHAATMDGFFAGIGLNAIPVTVNDDGTLVFPQFLGPNVCTTGCSGQEIIWSGTGTWDYLGRLALTIHAETDFFSAVGGGVTRHDVTFSGTK